MLFDAIRLVEGAELSVSSVVVGAEFPLGSPAIGELFYANGTGTPSEGLYVYTSSGWLINTDGYISVNKAGDTLTGFLTLHANPTASFHAATKQYVDTVAGSIVVTSITGPGYLNNALVAQGAITQHQASLVIAESQITDGSILARVAGTESITGIWTVTAPGELHVPTPTLATHATNKQYVDQVATGLTVRSAARLATVAPLPACTYNNGTGGVGATLTASANAALQIDGLPVQAGEAVLVKNQVDQKQNGVYTVQAAGANDPGGSLWILARRVSCDTAAEIPGSFVFVNDGTLTGTGWVLTVTDPLTFAVGTDTIVVQQFSDTGSVVLGGADTYVQFNDSGVLGGDADFTWNKTSNILNVAGTVRITSSGPATTANIYGASNDTVLETPSGSLYLNGTNASSAFYLRTGGINTRLTVANDGTTTFAGAAATTFSVNHPGGINLTGSKTTFVTPTTATASANLPHGVAPTSPVNGDIWTTTSGLYARINGATVGPIGTGVGAAAGSDTQVQFNDGGALGADAEFTYDKTANRLTVSGASGAFLSGDFSNATVTNRTKFQSATTNGNTTLTVVPNGAGTTAGALFSNAAVPTDSATVGLSINGTAAFLSAGTLGTGTELPLRVQTGASPVVAASFHPDGRTNFGPTTTYPDNAFNVEGSARFNSGVLVSNANTPAPLDATYFGIGFGSPANGVIGTTTPARTFVTANLYYGSAAWRHGDTGVAALLSLYDRDLTFQEGPSDSAGNAATLTTRLRWNATDVRFEVSGGVITNPSSNGLEPINLISGGSSGGSPAGNATLAAGASTGSGPGGAATLLGGASTGGVGGHVYVTSGASSAASTSSGDIIATIGAPGAGGTAGQFKWVSNTTRIATLHGATGNLNIGSNASDPGAKLAVQGLLLTEASDISEAGLRLPHGTAPTAPVNGDVWTTSAGMYAHINGGTVGPFGVGGSGLPTGSNTQVQYNNSGAWGADDDFTWNAATRTMALGAVSGLASLSVPNNLSIENDALYVDATNSRVGFGTNTPEATLHVRSQGTGNTRGIVLQHVDNTTAFSHAKFIGRRSRGSNGSPSAVQQDDSLVGYISQGYKTTGWSATTGGLYVYAAENWTDTATGTYVTIRGPAPGTTTVSERVRFEHLKTTFVGGIITAAGTTALASLRLPHGVAPTSPTDGDVWTTTTGMYARINGTTVGPLAAAGAATPGGSNTYIQFNDSGVLGGDADFTWDKTTNTLTITGGPTVLAAAAVGYPSLNLPHGTAPTSPTNGDVWTTSGGLYARINGVTVGPMGPNAPAGSDTQLQFNNGGAFGGDSDLTWNSTTNALTITGSTGARILGDLTNVIHANRLMFQTTAATSPTHLGAVPSTGGTAASFVAYANPAAANSAVMQVGIDSGTTYFAADVIGTATYPSFELRTGSSQLARITVNNAGNLTVGAADSGTTLVVNSASSTEEAVLAVGHVSQHQGNFSTAGDARTRTLVLRQTTTNASPAKMYLNGSSLQMVLANDSTWHFEIHVVARRTDADDESAGYRITGVIDRNGSAATTALVGTTTTTVEAEDTSAWNVAVSADTTDGALAITVTGETSKTIRWVAFVRTVEVIG